MTPQERRRDGHLRRTYNLTLAEYNELLEFQGGVCFICKEPPQPGKNLSIDHDHTDRTIRGALCTYCNMRFLKKSRKPERFVNAGVYLTTPPCQELFPGKKAPSKKRTTKRQRGVNNG